MEVPSCSKIVNVYCKQLEIQYSHVLGWYDRKNIGDFRTIIDVNFVAAMGPPGGGRNPVTARLLRHFHYIAFVEMEDDSKVHNHDFCLRTLTTLLKY